LTVIDPYTNVEEAQSYFDTRMHTESWDDADDSRRVKALVTATRAIDRLNYKGRKDTVDQAREFPRGGSIPDSVKIACCEIALALLDGVDPDLEEEALRSVTDAYATVRVTSDPSIRMDHIRAGIPSAEAWKYLLPLLNDPYSLVLRKG
jgi:hypothetical protein